jgi:hypothetical protein
MQKLVHLKEVIRSSFDHCQPYMVDS